MAGATRRRAGVTAAVTTAGLLVLAAGGTGGCAGDARPNVGTTAAELYAERPACDGAPGAAQLNFFDELESRPLVAQDDVVHAALLLGSGESAPTYPQRLEMARRLGYVRSGFSRPAHEAATVGDVAVIMTRLIEGAGTEAPDSEAEAVSRLVELGILPAPVKPYQGLTGRQLISVVGGVQDAMRARGVARSDVVIPGRPAPEPAAVAAGSAPAAAPVPAAPSSGYEDDPVPPPTAVPPSLAPAIASRPPRATEPPAHAPETIELADRPAPRGRPEPLPEIALAEQARAPRAGAAQPPERASPAAVPPPAPTPPAPPPPAPRPPEQAKKASPWVSGKPLSKPAAGGK